MKSQWLPRRTFFLTCSTVGWSNIFIKMRYNCKMFCNLKSFSNKVLGIHQEIHSLDDILCSFRYNPNLSFSQEFWFEKRVTNDYSPSEQKRLMLQRSCRLLVHETMHLLGFSHCIYYSCCMNGSGHLKEDFSPTHVSVPCRPRETGTAILI